MDTNNKCRICKCRLIFPVEDPRRAVCFKCFCQFTSGYDLSKIDKDELVKIVEEKIQLVKAHRNLEENEK